AWDPLGRGAGERGAWGPTPRGQRRGGWCASAAWLPLLRVVPATLVPPAAGLDQPPRLARTCPERARARGPEPTRSSAGPWSGPVIPLTRIVTVPSAASLTTVVAARRCQVATASAGTYRSRL